MTPSCFASPTAFNPVSDSRCRGCSHFANCGRESHAKLVALARVAPVQDLLDTLATQLQALGLLPVGGEGVSAPVNPPEPLQVPERTFGRIRRKELTQQELDLLGKFPVKVAKRMRPLMRAGLFQRLVPDLRAGKNPFPTSENLFLRQFADWLLENGEVVKRQAREGFRNAYGWSDMTAASHVSVAVTLLVTIGVARDAGDRIIKT